MSEDNRFLRVYTEYKQQERQEKQRRTSDDNRFACLKESYQPCSPSDNHSSRIDDKFSCLVDENYMNIRNTPRLSPRSAPYSPRSAPYSPRYEPIISAVIRTRLNAFPL